MFDNKKYQKEYRVLNKDSISATRKMYRLKNSKNIKNKHKEYYDSVLRDKKGHKKREKNGYTGLSPKERNRLIRLTVMRHYSGFQPKCACCGENEYKFLCIDHINGGGNEHRRTITKNGKGGSMANWLLKNGLPVGFQILCYNCNCSKGFYGQCPHTINDT